MNRGGRSRAPLGSRRLRIVRRWRDTPSPFRLRTPLLISLPPWYRLSGGSRKRTLYQPIAVIVILAVAQEVILAMAVWEVMPATVARAPPFPAYLVYSSSGMASHHTWTITGR